MLNILLILKFKHKLKAYNKEILLKKENNPLKINPNLKVLLWLLLNSQMHYWCEVT